MHTRLPTFVILGLSWVISVAPFPARAEILQMPAGGAAISLGNNRVLCGPLPAGFSTDERRKTLRPPTNHQATGVKTEVRVADSPGACAKNAAVIPVFITAPFPEIDATSLTFFADAGLLELKGQRLVGMQIRWQTKNQEGHGLCADPIPNGKTQSCAIPIERHLPSTTRFTYWPAGASLEADTFDAEGKPSLPVSRELLPVRIVLDQILPMNFTIDIAQGTGSIGLPRPEAVASVDCGAARCELSDEKIHILGVPGHASTLSVRMRLHPRFYLAKGEKLETAFSVTLPLLRCGLAVISGPPVRDVDENHVVVKMEDRCGHPTRVRWFVGSEPIAVEREIRREDGDYFLLRTGRLAGGQLTISAVKSDSQGGTLGSVTVPTMPAPHFRAHIELPGYGPIDFIPTNRDAVLTITGGGPGFRLVPLSIPGSTTIRTVGTQTRVRSEQAGGGFVNLRFGYRVPGLPEDFAQVNLAILAESMARHLREASIPAAFEAGFDRSSPLAELICSDGKGGTRILAPGQPQRIPFATRDTCRINLHQERLRPEDGTQEIVLEVDVTKANGGKRPEASLNERMVLHPQGQMRVVFLKSGTEEFDHWVVRLSHVIDESRYVLGPLAKQRPPSVQWTATLEGGVVRLYVTLTIPAGLYRMNDPVASMSLNFGVLGRLTTLDRRGKEGILGIETGVLGASLIPQRDNNAPAFPRTLVTLLGLGLRVVVGESAAVGVHLWGAYEFRNEYAYTPEGSTSTVNASHFSLLFGPSISIGSVGTNL